ncbi:hypothetical protein K1T71_005576 [Dendrolimus kikuchii]|uniref:Uncharacterized protein n=1 Tax=Dendrolimus kikuchii TaxID=765133 RepID=A0ACC1D4A7_9NEOP|nr:hypothetical protein K1T71_005576 [Dendrolimus kikuchii]
MTVAPNPQSVLEVIENKMIPEKSTAINWCKIQWRAVLAEMVATMMLVLFGCMACIPLDGFDLPSMYGAFGFGLAVLFNIQIFGHISGAHMNPAVTVAALIWKKLSFPLAVAYVIAQCLGAILGYGILVGVSPMNVAENGVCLTLPHANHNFYNTLGIEIVLTSALSLLNCAFWHPANHEKIESLAIKFGLAIVGLSLAGGPWTGASMNPARSLGPAVWTGNWTMHWVYWLGPMIGTSIAAVFYKITFFNYP